MLVHRAFELGSPAGIYVLAFSGLGVLAYLYCLLPFGRRAMQSSAYNVTSVEPTGGAVEVRMQPEGNGLRHKAGQFAFFRFAIPGLEEDHPFTISNAPGVSRELAITVKPLGDFTARLTSALTPGIPVSVAGPHGRFIRRGMKPEIWIAGGIGITPFVAWSGALEGQHAPVHLFYSARSEQQAPHLDRLKAAASGDPAFHVHFIDTSAGERLSMATVQRVCGPGISGARISFCGPKVMREQLRLGFAEAGIPASHFHYEEFEIRSGLGLERLLSWLLAILMAIKRRWWSDGEAMPFIRRRGGNR
jgi:predicted ferric reductase